MSDHPALSRRTFLRNGSLGAAVLSAPMILPSQVLSGPNDTINVGCIGVGRRMQDLKRDLGGAKGAQIVAISDVNKPRMEQQAAGKNWKMYSDFRQLLENKDVDAVMIATPDHWHALCAIYACMASKHVYIEKPMTLTVREGQVMVQAARKYNCIVQCGSQQRSMAACRYGCEMVRNGRLGKVQTVHTNCYPSPWEQPFPEQPVPDGLDWDTWLGPTPKRGYHIDLYTPRAKPGWISILPYSGGEVTGWGAHGLDMIQWALGTDETGPVEIWVENNSKRQLDADVVIKYETGVIVKLDNKGPEGGGFFECEKGTMLIDRGRFEANPKELVTEPTKDTETKLYVSNNHMQNWLDCIKSKQLPIADVAIGHRSTSVCHLANIARWTLRKLKWDPKAEQFIGDDDANTYLDRPRRKPWELPTI